MIETDSFVSFTVKPNRDLSIFTSGNKDLLNVMVE